jgi:hypothetical protein
MSGGRSSNLRGRSPRRLRAYSLKSSKSPPFVPYLVNIVLCLERSSFHFEVPLPACAEKGTGKANGYKQVKR